MARAQHRLTYTVACRDVKLENILLTHRKGLDIKLADFGLSKCFEHEPLQTMCGSPQYVSPEVLNMVDQRNGKVPAKVHLLHYMLACRLWYSHRLHMQFTLLQMSARITIHRLAIFLP